MFFRSELIAMAPEIFLIIGIHSLLVYGALCTTSSYLGYPMILTNVSWLSIHILIYSLILTFCNPLSYTICFNNLLISDEFTLFVKDLVLIVTIIAILISIKYNQFEKISAFESMILILLSVLGILLLISSLSLVSIYLALELQSFCLYVLAALNRNSEFSTEAGLKYFVLGAFSSGLLLFGFSLIYGFTGISELNHLFQFLCVVDNCANSVNGISVASIFILAALFFKLSAVPFHLWAPDIYEGAPTSITAFFAIVPKIGVLALLTRLCFTGFYDMFFSWQELLLLASISSILLGTFGALVQLKLKRLLAYSSIGHMGYILIGLCCGSFEGVQATYVYILVYVAMTIVCFAILLGVYENKRLTRLTYLKDLTILKRSNPILALTLSIAFFSMAGIPPLSGFFSKMFLFIVTIQCSMYFVAFVGVLMSVISCFYYIRIIRSAYFDTNYLWVSVVRLDREKSLILGGLTLMLVGFWLYPSTFLYLTYNALYLVIRNQDSI